MGTILRENDPVGPNTFEFATVTVDGKEHQCIVITDGAGQIIGLTNRLPVALAADQQVIIANPMLTIQGAVTLPSGVTVNNPTLTVQGMVAISNTSIAVTGEVEVSGIVSVDNFPTNQTVTVSNATLQIAGNVNVGNLPSNQTVTISNPSLTISNFPDTQATTEADGANVTLGATTDAAITTNAPGTLSAKLRGIVAILADVWNTVSHALKIEVVGTPTVTVGNPGLTDAQMRASSVNVAVTNAPNPQPTSTANGENVAMGATTDAAVTTNITASLMARFRGLLSIFADIWNSADHALRVTFPSSQNVTLSNSPTIKIAAAPDNHVVVDSIVSNPTVNVEAGQQIAVNNFPASQNVVVTDQPPVEIATNQTIGITADDPIPVTIEGGSSGGGLTNTELRASPLSVMIDGIGDMFRMLLQAITRPIWFDSSLGSLRIYSQGGVLSTVTTVSTVTTCAAVTSVNALGGLSATETWYNLNHLAWEHNVRAKIT